MKKFLIGTLALGAIVATTSGIFAAEDLIKTPAEILAKLTGKTVEQVYEQKGGKTFGEIAQDNGVFDKFKNENLKSKEVILDERVKDGTITKEQKEDILKQMENCNGQGQNLGRQFGFKMGQGRGTGNGGCQGQFGVNQ